MSDSPFARIPESEWVAHHASSDIAIVAAFVHESGLARIEPALKEALVARCARRR